MSISTYTKLRHKRKWLTKCNVPINGVTSDSLDIIGTIHLRMRICEIQTAAVFYVCNDNIDTFLGWEIIKKIGYGKIFDQAT